MSKSILLMYSNFYPSSEHAQRLKKIAKGYKINIAANEKDAVDMVCDAEIIAGHRFLRQSLPNAKKLAWVQSTSGGVDRLPLQELKKKKVVLTRFSGASAVLARHSYTLAWAILRNLPIYFEFQKKRIWDKNVEFLPQPKKAMILGYGSIGKELAKLLKKDGLYVIGVKRKVSRDKDTNCDFIIDDKYWKKYLSDIDICFLCLPLNKETNNIFDEEALKLLPKHAVLVNVGRGETLDQEALIKVLKQGWLGGVGLDVVASINPKKNDPIWNAPRVVLTPYSAARYNERQMDVEEFFELQLRLYLAGKMIKCIC